MRDRFVAAVIALVLVTAPWAGTLSAQGQQVSITVKGHWEIEVREKNGALVSRTEFANALMPSGTELLAYFLSGTGTPGKWAVFVDGVCSGSTGWCAVRAAPFSGSPPTEFAGLQTTVVWEQDRAGIRLRGSFDATRTGIITTVRTGVGSCTAREAPALCSAAATDYFSGTSISGIAVANEQNVQVTVTFTFS